MTIEELQALSSGDIIVHRWDGRIAAFFDVATRPRFGRNEEVGEFFLARVVVGDMIQLWNHDDIRVMTPEEISVWHNFRRTSVYGDGSIR